MYKNSDETFLLTLNTLLAENPRATQREIAARLDISLGLANQILTRVTEKGWVQIDRVNSRNMRYVITAAGMAEIARLEDERKRDVFAEMRTYSEQIVRCIGEAKANGVEKVVLYGESDLDFLISYACARLGMAFEKRADGVRAAGCVDVFALVDGAMDMAVSGLAGESVLAIAGERDVAEDAIDAVGVMEMAG